MQFIASFEWLTNQSSNENLLSKFYFHCMLYDPAKNPLCRLSVMDWGWIIFYMIIFYENILGKKMEIDVKGLLIFFNALSKASIAHFWNISGTTWRVYPWVWKTMSPREVCSLQAVGEDEMPLQPYFPLLTMPLLHNRHLEGKGRNAELQKPVQ